MSGKIPREFIDDLLVRVDIVDLIDSHVPLKKAGANYVARCPFHTEKTPSFSVNRSKQFFHCFGCEASGNAISFLMDFSHLSFVEAVEELADFVGVDVPLESKAFSAKHQGSDLSALYKVMEQVATVYVEQLRSNPEGKSAVDYLKVRGVSSRIAHDFMLGYAPKQWQLLTDQFDQQLLIDAGLLGKNDGDSLYGRFRGRVMFPIRDKRGRTIAFGGRVLDDSLPKYLNSPETPLFSKGREVYGLYELLRKHPKPQKILIVEGYMDVVALAEFGIDYVVATLGTATSQAHLDLLFRFSSELIFCFDGDKAGQAAALRAMEPAFSSLRDGRQIRIMLLPDGHDPDSLVRERGLDGFLAQIESAEVLSDYFFKSMAKDLNLTEMESRANLVARAKPYLDKLPDGIFKGMMFGKLKELSNVVGLSVDKSPGFKGPVTKASKQIRGVVRLSTTRVALALLVQNPRLAELVVKREIDWSGIDFPGIDVFKSVLQVIEINKPANAAVMLELYRGSEDEKMINALACLELLVPEEGVESEFCGALDRLMHQARLVVLDKLLIKEKSGGLEPQEKEKLRSLLAIECRTTK